MVGGHRANKKKYQAIEVQFQTAGHPRRLVRGQVQVPIHYNNLIGNCGREIAHNAGLCKKPNRYN